MNEQVFTSNIVPKRYRAADMTQYSEKQREMARAWIREPRSLFIYGENGVGKTHFVFALLRYLMKNRTDLWPRYFQATDLDRNLLNAMDKTGGEHYEIYARSTDSILFIDDFGRESNTDRLRRQYFDIINRRYNDELPTIITSNMTLQEIANMKDNAVASRLQEYDAIHMKGSDRRKKTEN